MEPKASVTSEQTRAAGIPRLRDQAVLRAAARGPAPPGMLAFAAATDPDTQAVYEFSAAGPVVALENVDADDPRAGQRQRRLPIEMFLHWPGAEIGGELTCATYWASLTLRAEGSYRFCGGYVNLGDRPESAPLHNFCVAAVVVGGDGAGLSFAVRGRNVASVPQSLSRPTWRIDGSDTAIADRWTALARTLVGVLAAANATAPGGSVSAIPTALCKLNLAGCRPVTVVPILAHVAAR